LISTAIAQERQLTTAPRNHALDNNDNYSANDRYLCFDTRMTRVFANGASASIMKVDVRTGEESVVYEPQPAVLTKTQVAPGVIAASYHPSADEIVFIHGPLLSETAESGFYAKTNRRGAVAQADGTSGARFLDHRDVTSAVTPPGAQRGGTHRHEYSGDGQRIGFTYDDHLLPGYGRTVGLLVPRNDAPSGATHWFTILVPVVPQNDARPGDLVSATSDSWVGRHGLLRAFIGRVKEADGTFRNSLYVVEIPAHVDVTTAQAGTRSTFPTPPQGVRVRRLTHTNHQGIVRGSPDGQRIAYLAQDANGKWQVFLIGVDGQGVTQLTRFPAGVRHGARWHPSGHSLAVVTDEGVAVVSTRPGTNFGKSVMLTRHAGIEGLVWSNHGRQLAYNRRVPHPSGAKDGEGLPFLQIFTIAVPGRILN